MGKHEQGLMETVVRVSHKQRGNGNTTSSEAVAGNSTVSNHTSSAKAHEMESDVDRMIDSHDNEFVLSKPKSVQRRWVEALRLARGLQGARCAHARSGIYSRSDDSLHSGSCKTQVLYTFAYCLAQDSVWDWCLSASASPSLTDILSLDLLWAQVDSC